MRRLLLSALFGASLLTPSAALGAPHWSSPVRVAPPGATAPGISGAHAFISNENSSLAVFSDGLQPLVAGGDVRGVFSAPFPLGLPVGGTSGLDADLGNDGTMAVAWIAGGAAHVAVAPAGRRAAAQTDLPGAGVSDVAVAVNADGSATVAYRTKPGPGSYELLAASAAPGEPFSPPVTLHTSSQGIDGLEAAAGPGGAVAITYRRLAPKYRAYAVVRPPGTSLFNAPQTLSPGTQPDIDADVAFQPDGTIVAAWTNSGGAAYAVRPPGATRFAAPSALGPAGEASYLIDLRPTPQRGVVAAWSAAGKIRSAIKPADGPFDESAAVVKTTSEITAEPAVTAVPGGPVTVISGDPDSGAIVATDVFGAGETIGYGAVLQPLPVAVVSAADRTVALWRDSGGALAAATRSELAPVSTGPGAAPAPPDRTRPALKLNAPRRITVSAKTSAISFKATSSEPTSLLVFGRMQTTRGGKRVISPLGSFRSAGAPKTSHTVRLTLGPGARADLRRALAARRGASVFVDATATDSAGNATRVRVQLTLRPKTQRRR